MSYTATAAINGLVLPDGHLYNTGDPVTLSDADYTTMGPTVRAAVLTGVTGAPGTATATATGLTGATGGARLIGGNASGAPATGTFAVRDEAVNSDGTVWVCTAAGSPGTWVQVGGAGGVLAPTFTYNGTLTVLTGVYRWYNDTGRTVTISQVRASVGTAPTGASVIVDVRKNGTSIYTTVGNRPAIAAGTQTATEGGLPDTRTVAYQDYLTVDVVQIGSGTAGASLTVTVTAA